MTCATSTFGSPALRAVDSLVAGLLDAGELTGNRLQALAAEQLGKASEVLSKALPDA